MEGVTVGQVFDAECILSKRPRKGKFEYLVKWRGWSSKLGSVHAPQGQRLTAAECGLVVRLLSAEQRLLESVPEPEQQQARPGHLEPGLGVNLDRGSVSCSREQERELLFQKKGKRPRGRPRKILQPPPPAVKDSRSSSSSSSGLSSTASSSSDDDDEDHTKKAKRLHPVPQKRPQMLLAKLDPPRKKKRGRKPLHPDLRALRQVKSRPPAPPAPPPPPAAPPSPAPPRHHQALRLSREDPRSGVKKPLQPASFTYNRPEQELQRRGLLPDLLQLLLPDLRLQTRVAQLHLGQPLPVLLLLPSSSSSHSKAAPSSQSKNSGSELKRSASESGGRGDGFKVSPLKQSSGSGSVGLHSSFGGVQVAQRSQLTQRRQDAVGAQSGSVQHKQQNSGLSKPSMLSSSTQRDRASQALSLRALNLQSVNKTPAVSSSAGAASASRSSLRSSSIVVKGGVGGIKETRMSTGLHRSASAAGGTAETGRGKDGGGSVRGGAVGRQDDRKHGLSSQNRSLNELSTGDSDETSSSESEHDAAAALYPSNSRPSLGNDATESDMETDWRPTRSLLEHVFVTDVTANFITRSGFLPLTHLSPWRRTQHLGHPVMSHTVEKLLIVGNLMVPPPLHLQSKHSVRRSPEQETG
ncbi:hypothetical protein INR49_020209, partial [Caranx melampygus]